MALLAQRNAPTRGAREPILLTVGRTGPDLRDTVVAQDGAPPTPWPATTVLFSMRPLLSRQPFVDGAVGYAIDPSDPDGFNVGYVWQAADRAIEGRYMAWWGYVLSGGTLEETQEFQIIISDHGPGLGSPTGVVVDGVAEYMPVTLDALRSDERFGDRFLQRTADRAKRDTMGVAVAPDAESAYDPALVQYLSMRTAILLITPAKEYWARQYRTATTQGPTEIASYPDMIATLTALRISLVADAADLWRQLQFIVPDLPQGNVMSSPATSFGPPTAFNQPVTPDPNCAQRPVFGGNWYGYGWF